MGSKILSINNEPEIEIGLFGLGTLGSGVIEYLQKFYDSRKTGIRLKISHIVVANPSKNREISIDTAIISNDKNDILNNDKISIVVELIGGIEPAKSIIIEAFRKGKDVVTANKAILAEYGTEIFAEARRNKRNIAFQGAVCGEMRVLDELLEIPSHRDTTSIVGIVNGSSNFVLDSMEKGLSYDSAVKDAKEKGITEKDESFDLEGIDAAQKLTIIASVAFGDNLTVTDVFREGITKVTTADIEYSRKLGYSIKPLAIAKKSDILELRVHPALVPLTHPLSSVRAENNAVSIYLQNRTEPRTIIGKGAGSPTSTSILSDIVELAKKRSLSVFDIPRIYSENIRQNKISKNEFITPFYLRFNASNNPGVLSKISGVLGENGINISKAIQMEFSGIGNTTPLVLTVDAARNSSLRKAISDIEKLNISKESLAIPIIQ